MSELSKWDIQKFEAPRYRNWSPSSLHWYSQNKGVHFLLEILWMWECVLFFAWNSASSSPTCSPEPHFAMRLRFLKSLQNSGNFDIFANFSDISKFRPKSASARNFWRCKKLSTEFWKNNFSKNFFIGNPPINCGQISRFRKFLSQLQKFLPDIENFIINSANPDILV